MLNSIPHWFKFQASFLLIGCLLNEVLSLETYQDNCPIIFKHILHNLGLFWKEGRLFSCSLQINKVVRKNLITVLSKSFLVHQSWIVFSRFYYNWGKNSHHMVKKVLRQKERNLFRVSLINWWNFIFDSDWHGLIEWQVEFEFYLQKSSYFIFKLQKFKCF